MQFWAGLYIDKYLSTLGGTNVANGLFDWKLQLLHVYLNHMTNIYICRYMVQFIGCQHFRKDYKLLHVNDVYRSVKSEPQKATLTCTIK